MGLFIPPLKMLNGGGPPYSKEPKNLGIKTDSFGSNTNLPTSPSYLEIFSG